MDLGQKSIGECSELKRFPSLQGELAQASIEALERMRDDSKKPTLRMVDMEASYLTVDFFQKLPQEIKGKGSNAAAPASDRYTDGHLRRIGSNVSAYIGMVCDQLRNSLPKAAVHSQVREATHTLLDHFYTQIGKREEKKLSPMLDEDPALMERNCPKGSSCTNHPETRSMRWPGSRQRYYTSHH